MTGLGFEPDFLWLPNPQALLGPHSSFKSKVCLPKVWSPLQREYPLSFPSNSEPAAYLGFLSYLCDFGQVMSPCLSFIIYKMTVLPAAHYLKINSSNKNVELPTRCQVLR